MHFKHFIFSFVLAFIVVNGIAQVAQTHSFYLDGNEKPTQKNLAVYLVKVGKVKTTDSDWTWEMFSKADNKLVAQGRSLDSLCTIKHGAFANYYFKGEKHETGRYANGKKDGQWISLHPEGQTSGKFNYSEGSMTGLNMTWYKEGAVLDSFPLDKSGNGMGYGFYENGKKRYEGIFSDGVKSGSWTYYYNETANTKSMEVVFEADSLISSTCFAVNGQLQTTNCVYEREANIKGGETAWRNYLVQELSSSNYPKYMKKIDVYKVMVAFVVSKTGEIMDAKVENPDNKKLDKIAEEIITNSPRWEPAVQYNQKVNAYRRQPLTFTVQ